MLKFIPESCAVIIEILQSLNENSSSAEPLQSFPQRRIGIGWKLAFICSPLLLPMQLDYVHLVQTSNDFQVKANIEFGFIKWKKHIIICEKVENTFQN